MNKEQLEKLSDLHINRMIVESFGHKLDWDVKEHQDSGLCETNYKDDAVYITERGYLEFLNYCNNPSDMMPLAFEAGIDLVSPVSNASDDWQAGKFFLTWKSAINVYHKNPLRAAAIVWLLMQGEI